MSTPEGAADREAPDEHAAFLNWSKSITVEQRYDFDSEGRGYKKDAGTMMWLAWQARAALSQSAAASTRVEPASWMPCEFVTIDGNSRCKTCGQVRHSGCDAGGRQAKAPAPKEPKP